MRSPWVTTILFLPNPALITNRILLWKLGFPIFCKVPQSYQPTWYMPPVLGFAFKPSARNFTVPALSVSYTLPPHRRVRDFHPLEKSAAKRTKEDGPQAHPPIEFSYFVQDFVTQRHQAIHALHLLTLCSSNDFLVHLPLEIL